VAKVGVDARQPLQIDVQTIQSGERRMNVGVLEPGQNEAAVCVDDFSVSRGRGVHVAAAEGHDRAVAHTDGVGPAARGITSEDRTAANDQLC